MPIRGVELLGLNDQPLHLLHPRPRIGARHWGDENPIGPGLRDEPVRLDLIQHLLALLAGNLGLVLRGCGYQRPSRLLQLEVKLIDFFSQGHELMPCVLILAQGGDRLSGFFRIDLRRQVHADDHGLSVEARAHRLIQDQHHAGRIRPDFVFGDVEVGHDRDALQVGRDLFESVLFSSLRREPKGILTSVAISHPVFPARIDDPDLRCDGCHKDAGKTGTGEQQSETEAASRWRERAA